MAHDVTKVGLQLRGGELYKYQEGKESEPDRRSTF
jgi:hypothetical protein